MTTIDKIEHLKELIEQYDVEYVHGAGAPNTICDVLRQIVKIVDELAAKIEVEINP